MRGKPGKTLQAAVSRGIAGKLRVHNGMKDNGPPISSRKRGDETRMAQSRTSGTEDNEVERLTLEVLAENMTPVGAGALAEALRSHGLSLSMATAGRLLWDLDCKGYTERRSNRGRVLSPSGKARLEELRAAGTREMLARELLEELASSGPKKLLDVLGARRALERETARLAAIFATERDLQEIGNFAALLDIRSGNENAAEATDRKFHEAVARAGGNLVLAAAMNLIRQDTELAHVLTAIRRTGKHPLGGYHRPIYEAIAAKDPTAAEQAMLTHIDGIIGDVAAFFREHHHL